MLPQRSGVAFDSPQFSRLEELKNLEARMKNLGKILVQSMQASELECFVVTDSGSRRTVGRAHRRLLKDG